MTPWLLLIFTVICAYATSVTSRLAQGISRAPFSIAHLWKGGLSHLSVAEKDKVQQDANRFLANKIFVISAVSTVLLAVKIARAFFPWL